MTFHALFQPEVEHVIEYEQSVELLITIADLTGGDDPRTRSCAQGTGEDDD